MQLNDPSYAGGANRVSLTLARLNYRSFGASDEQSRPYVRPPNIGEMPDSIGQK